MTVATAIWIFPISQTSRMFIYGIIKVKQLAQGCKRTWQWWDLNPIALDRGLDHTTTLCSMSKRMEIFLYSFKTDCSISSLLLAKVHAVISCFECGKRRVVYSPKKLTNVELRTLIRLEESFLHSCGSTLFPVESPHHDQIVVKEALNYESPMETSYYAGMFRCMYMHVSYGAPVSSYIITNCPVLFDE
jgi:hypothetical protein